MATILWNRWTLCDGLGGRIHVEQMPRISGIGIESLQLSMVAHLGVKNDDIGVDKIYFWGEFKLQVHHLMLSRRLPGVTGSLGIFLVYN
jgi:hypothetical protein